jgi:hypothetical protein
MTPPPRSAAVLGAGTMGAQIAAHFANAGVPIVLLDLTADIARDGLKRAGALKPDPFFTPAAAALITTGGFDSDLAKLSGVDWILEAVVEQLDVKRALLERVETVRRPGTIVSSNTSGIPIAALGGAYPSVLGLGGACLVLTVARMQNVSGSLRFIVCVGITVLAWLIFLTIIVEMMPKARKRFYDLIQ